VPAAVLVGRVTEVSSHSPVAGARVVATTDSDTYRARTDLLGIFLIFVPDTELALDVHAEGFLPPRRRTVSPKVSDHSLTFELQRGASLDGRIVDLAGAPIAGAELELSGEVSGKRQLITAAERARRRIWAEGSGDAPPSSRLLRVGELGVLLGKLPGIPPEPRPAEKVTSHSPINELVSRPDGSFRVDAVAPGRWTVRAHHPDFADAESAVIAVPSATPLTVVMARGSEVSGRIADAAGEPIFGATVAVRDKGRTRAVVFTGSDGGYRHLHVLGDVVVSASAHGFSAAQREVVAGEGGLHEISFILAASDEASAPGEEVAGAIQADLRDGSTLGPLLAFHVTARGPGGARLERAGKQGELQVGPLAAGRWTLTVEAVGYAARAVVVDVVAGDPTPVRIELDQGATIAGTVYSSHGEPVAGADVACGLARTRTTATGGFRLAGVPSGLVAVVASHPREGRGRIQVPLRNGDEALTLAIRLESGR